MTSSAFIRTPRKAAQRTSRSRWWRAWLACILAAASTQVIADQNVDISAGRNVHVLLARDGYDSSFESHSKSTSVGILPGLSPSLTLFGKNSTNERGTDKVGTGSTAVISANAGNVVIRAGTDEKYKGTGEGNVVTQGADLLAKDRVSISGNAVDLQAAVDTRDSTYHMDSKSFIIGARPAGVLGAVVNAANDVYESSRNGSSDRLVAANALKAGYDTYKFIGNGGLAGARGADIDAGNKLVEQAQKTGEEVDPSKLDPNKTSIGVQVYFGSNKSTQDSESHSTTRRGTNIQAANIDVTANEGNITAQGAKLQAQNIVLDAAKDIKLGSAQSTASIKSSNSSSSVGGGVTVGLGDQSGISFQANWGQTRGNANGSETAHDNTQVLASNSLSIKSGGNTELKGAQLSGKTVKADIGGDLRIETQQDESQYESKQSSTGFNISVCVPPICYGTPVTGSVQVSKTTIDHNYQSATGQSGIAAGEGGYDIKVAGNTDLKGGAITSAAPKEKNSLQTQSLTFSDLDNKQTTDVSASSLSAGYGGGSMLGTVAGNAGANLLGNTAAKAGLPESGSQSSQTQSVISPGSVVITGKDESGSSQQAANTLTGRDATTANQRLKNNLTLVEAQDIQKNQQKVQDDIRAAGLIGSVGAEMIGDAAKKNDWSPQTKVLAHGLLGVGMAVIGGGSAGTGFITGAANEMALNAMSDYIVNNGVAKGSEDYKQLMMAGSAFLGTVVGKAAGGSTTDVALSGQTAKVATENNYLKHPQIVAKKAELENAQTAEDRAKIEKKYDQLDKQQGQEAAACLLEGKCSSTFTKGDLRNTLDTLNASCAPPRVCSAEAMTGIKQLHGYYEKAEAISPDTTVEVFLMGNKLAGAALDGVKGVWTAATGGAKTGSSVADDFFAGTRYTDKVSGQVKTGDLHAFPEGVGAFQGAGQVTRITGGDGVVRDMLKIPGEYRGKQGFFEFIREPDGAINHRLFRPSAGQ
jgi:filamentous hemagglutinin